MKGSIGQRINVETCEMLLPLGEWERKPGNLKGEFIYSDVEKDTLLCVLSICNFLFRLRTFILWTIFHSMHMIYELMNTFMHACFFT